MNCKLIFKILMVIAALSINASAVTINETLDTTDPATNPAYRAETGTQTGRLTRNGTASECDSAKPNPGLFSSTGSRQYDDYRFVALSAGCITVTLSNAGDNVLFGVAYDQNGLSISDPSLNHLADMGASPTTANPTRSFGFYVFEGQIFHLVVHEVNAGGGIGQTYTLDVDGAKLDPDFSVTEVLDGTAPNLDPAYSRASGSQTGRLNRFSPASDCSSLKPNPGLFTPTGARRADLYVFTPASSGCARVTLSHTGAHQAQIVVYDQNGFVPSNPSTNYLADPGISAMNSSVTFSFLVTRGLPFSIIVNEVNPGAGIGDSYTLNISNVNLVPTVRINSRLDGAAPFAHPDFTSVTGVQTGRINRFPPVADCNAPKPFPGLFTPTGARQFDSYTFIPTGSGCVEVTLKAFTTGFDLYAAVYDNVGFIPANPGSNYLADHGNSPNNVNPRTFSFNVTSGVPFTIVVHEVNPGGGVGQDYILEVGGISLNVTLGSETADFDGDERTDLSIFRPSVGEWWYLRSGDGGNRAFQFGMSSDKMAPADFTGDGKTDIAFFRPSLGEWFILRSEDFSFYSFPFGINGDIPIPADFDGDGKGDPTVFRPSNLTWYTLRSSDSVVTFTTFGVSGDKPVPGDYDGDGKADIAIFRPGVGQWWYLRSGDGGNRAYNFGISSDLPVQADYTGDGKTDIAFFRPSNGEWFILRSEDDSFYSFPFGTGGDLPSPGDYDGDGRADAAIFRNGTWFVQQSTFGTAIQSFGIAGDISVPSAYVQ